MRDDRRRLVAAALMTMAGLASWPAFAADGDSAGLASDREAELLAAWKAGPKTGR